MGTDITRFVSTSNPFRHLKYLEFLYNLIKRYKIFITS